MLYWTAKGTHVWDLTPWDLQTAIANSTCIVPAIDRSNPCKPNQVDQHTGTVTVTTGESSNLCQRCWWVLLCKFALKPYFFVWCEVSWLDAHVADQVGDTCDLAVLFSNTVQELNNLQIQNDKYALSWLSAIAFLARWVFKMSARVNNLSHRWWIHNFTPALHKHGWGKCASS